MSVYFHYDTDHLKIDFCVCMCACVSYHYISVCYLLDPLQAYVQSFSESVGVECRDRGVRVQCLLPGFVVSNMSKVGFRYFPMVSHSFAMYVVHVLTPCST